MKPGRTPVDNDSIRHFEDKNAWEAWLADQHGTSSGLWLRLAKKGSVYQSVSYAEALEVALCHGWIDGQKKSDDEDFWLQKFTPRAARSLWSKVNREKALALIEVGRMSPAGLREVERAQGDGRWDAAYAPSSGATVPEDFQSSLDANPKAKAFFETLKSQNRYAFLFRVQTAKKPETRAKRIQQFIQMLENHETFHP